MDLNSFSLLFSALISIAIAADDTAVLILFRSQTDLHATLTSNWTPASTACTANWVGVHCSGGRVTAVSLPSANLRGPIGALASLDQLRLLDLRGNRLNGALDAVAQCLNLKLAYLSGNDFSGEIPPELSSLHRLLRLDLSRNNLRGSIPAQFSKLSRLLTLHLQNNELSGIVPNFLDSLPQLKELNLSNNEFYGMLPDRLISRYGSSSFSGNQGLCGSDPFPNCSYTGDQSPPRTVPSNPSSLPSPSSISIEDPSNRHHHHHSLSNGAVTAIVVANSVLLLALILVAAAYYCSRSSIAANSTVAESDGGKSSSYSSEKRVHTNREGTHGSNQSKLVFFDRKKQFKLEDLLQASAEMLGKGGLGTVYKAVLEDGSTVAVKRLKDANPCGRKEFEQYMDVMGKLKHPNVVRFRAYYYAREEKLLVYDYLPNGSLHSLLHEGRGPGRIPLDWTTRISLILGAARGLARIHEECYGGSRIPHGNVKSSNVLLDKNGVACVSDFGLSLLLNPGHAVGRLGGYRAPEQSEVKRVSQKADVYGFGVVVLEVISGRDPVLMDLPKWAGSVVRDEWTADVFDPELLRYKNVEEELVSMLHVAMACTVEQPEKRPGMDEVLRMVEEMRVEDYDESRNSMSSSIMNTEDGLP